MTKESYQNKPKKNKFKRIIHWLIGLSLIFFLLLIIALILPFIIDLNKFKPQIQQIVSEKINAKIDFSSARLTILTGIGINLQNVSIENTDEIFNKTKLFSVKELKFSIELLPFISKQQIIGELNIHSPEINIVNKLLNNNISSLIKPSNTSEITPTPTVKEDNTSEEEMQKKLNMAKQKILIKAINIQNAQFTLKNIDNKEKMPLKINNLNLFIKNIGLERDINIKFYTNANYNDNGIITKGKISLNIISNIKMNTKSFDNVKFNVNFNANKFDINVKNAFIKKENIPLNFNFSGKLTPKTLEINDFIFTLHTLLLKTSINITNLDDLNSKITLNVNNKNLASFSELLPQHKHLLTNAFLDISADINGPLKTPEMATANAKIFTQIGDTDFNFSANLQSILPPKAKISIKSKKINLDSLLKPFISQNKTAQPKTDDKKTDDKKTDDKKTNNKLNPKEIGLPANIKAKLSGSDISLNIDINEFLFDKIKINNIAFYFKQKNLNAFIEKIAFNTFGINLNINANANLLLNPPQISSALSLTGGDININSILNDLGITPSTSQNNKLTQPTQNDNNEPAKDFSLQPEQKQLLSNIDSKVKININSISYDKYKIEKFNLDTRLTKLLANINNFSMTAFEGNLNFKGDINLNQTPIAFTSDIKLHNIKIEKLIEFIKPEHKELLKGTVDIDIPLKGAGTTVHTLSKTLNGSGLFLMNEGELHSASIANLATEELNKFISTLSVISYIDNTFKSVENITNNQLAKQAMTLTNAPKLNINTYKTEFDKIKQIKLNILQTDNKIKDLKASFRIENGNILIKNKKNTSLGEMFFDGGVNLETNLTGNANINFAKNVKDKMLSQSKYANLLFDDKGELQLNAKLSGTVSEPKVSIDFNQIKERFTNNIKILLDKEVKSKVNDFIQNFIKNKVDAASAELKKKLEAEKAKLEAEKNKIINDAKVKADELKKKAQTEADTAKKKAQAEADAAKKKVEEEAKKKALEEAQKKGLKGLFGK